MNKFIWISDNFRIANDKYVQQNYDRTLIKEYQFYRAKELDKLNSIRRVPRLHCLNDMCGKEHYLWNMDSRPDMFPRVDYEFTDSDKLTGSIDDVMFDRAKELKDKNKMIDLFYSGGLDSVAIVFALREVGCPRDQINIISSMDAGPINYPKLWTEYIEGGPVTLDYGNINGVAKVNTNLFVTGDDADQLFGAAGQPAVQIVDIVQGYRENYDQRNFSENQSHYWPRIKLSIVPNVFKKIKNVQCNIVDLNNYQPFYLDENMIKYSINKHINKEITYFPDDFVDYTSHKKILRDFVAKYDAVYAAEVGKTSTNYSKANRKRSKGRVYAITNDGTVVTKDNLEDFVGPKSYSLCDAI